MKRIVSMLLALLMLSLAGCVVPASPAPPAETPYAPRSPYAKPEVKNGEILLWYGDGQHYSYSLPRYVVIGFPDEYIAHTDKTYKFDDGPEKAKWSNYFSSVLTGKAPVSGERIVILVSEEFLPWEDASLNAILYDVSVDDALRVTLGEPMLSEDVTVCFKRAAECEMLPIQTQSNYASEDGGFHISDSITDGTPYMQNGIIYDRTMLGMEKGGEYDAGEDSQAVGGGTAHYRWEFTPLKPGESDILILTDSFNEGLMGKMVHVSVDEALGWSLSWYAEGSVGKDFHIYVAVEGQQYQIDVVAWA